MENWKFALKSILAHKMRSLLTMLGIIIGVAAVVVIVALGTGMSKSIEKALAGDQNNVEVYFMPYTESDESSSMGFFGSIGGGEMSMEEEPDLTDAMLQGLLEIDGISNYYISLSNTAEAVSYTRLRAHETEAELVCRLLIEKKNLNTTYWTNRS